MVSISMVVSITIYSGGYNNNWTAINYAVNNIHAVQYSASISIFY